VPPGVLQLESSAADTLDFLVENHLLHGQRLAAARLDDRAVIPQFCRGRSDAERLNLLDAADVSPTRRATSDKLWSGFKDSLLWQLHSRTMTLLVGGIGIPVRAGQEQQEVLRQEVAPRRRAGLPRGLTRTSRRCRALFPDSPGGGNPSTTSTSAAPFPPASRPPKMTVRSFRRRLADEPEPAATSLVKICT